MIARYILKMLPYMLCSLPAIIIFRVIRIRIMKRKSISPSPWHEAGAIVFLLFLVGLASLTVLSEIGNFAGINFRRINVIPFKVISETYRAVFVDRRIDYFIINFLGNIVMFMPIGFFLPLLWRVTFKRTLLIGFSISLLIELCQLFLARGSDIDDLWINTLGTAAGYAVFILLKKPLPGVAKFKIHL